MIPCFNEEQTIGSVALLAREHAARLIVVDDGSTDATGAIARAAGAEVVRIERNSGKGVALAAGFRAALAGGADVVVTLDGDGQHDARSIPALVAPIEKGDADVVIGSRRLDAAQRKGIPTSRRVVQRALAATAGTGVTDSESGFRAYRASLIAGIALKEQGYGTEWEALQRVQAAGARILEVPIEVRYLRTRGKKGPLAHGSELVGGILRYVRGERPLAFFGVPGAILLVVGMVLGLQTATHYYSTGEFWPGKAMLSMLASILGAISLLGAIILDSIATMLRRSDRQ